MPKDRKQDPRYKPLRQEYERNRKTILATTAIKEGSLQLIPEEGVDFGERKEAIHE